MPDVPVPTYYRIKVALLEEIGRGEYLPGRSFITEREVCARFGVSRTTAVRVLGELERDGVLTRHRGRGSFVSGAPSPAEDRAHGSSTRLIGCIFHALHGPHPMAIIRGIEQVCRAEDYHLLLFDSVTSPQIEAQNLRRAREAGVRGLIVYPVDGTANAAHFEAIRHDGVPLVLIDRYYPTLATDVVVADDVGDAYALTDYLVKEGHTHIAVMWGEETACTSVVDRLTGYRQALRDNSLSLQPELAVLRRYTALPQEGRLALLTSWLAAPYRPTAYLAVNSQTLAMVAADLLSLGVRLPEEAVLASMDNASLDTLLALATATATLPSYEMGSTAMRLLHERLTGAPDRPCQHVVLPVTVSTTPSVAVNLWRVAT